MRCYSGGFAHDTCHSQSKWSSRKPHEQVSDNYASLDITGMMMLGTFARMKRHWW